MLSAISASMHARSSSPDGTNVDNSCDKELDLVKDCDPDKLLQCPYDKNHQIRACRFPYHLLKCRKNHPQLARELKTCPFNARHLVPKNELSHHTATCEDKRYIHTGTNDTEQQYKWQVPCPTWTTPVTEEDWEQESDDSATPFVWGLSTSPNRRLAPDTSSLTSVLRAPKTLPWPAFRQ